MTTTEVKKQTVAAPTERVPIMIEITKEDVEQAGNYNNCKSCLIATALRRMGHKPCVVSPRTVQLTGPHDYYGGSLGCDDLGWDVMNQRWSPDAVGCRHVIYPI